MIGKFLFWFGAAFFLFLFNTQSACGKVDHSILKLIGFL